MTDLSLPLFPSQFGAKNRLDIYKQCYVKWCQNSNIDHNKKMSKTFIGNDYLLIVEQVSDPVSGNSQSHR
jgi:hypothetical protein